VRTEYLGAATTLANGKLRRDLVNTQAKRRFSLAWTRLSASQRADVEAAYDAAVKGEVAFVGPDGVTCTVTAGPQPAASFEGWVSARKVYFRGSLELYEA
jgi:hypothetical protein